MQSLTNGMYLDSDPSRQRKGTTRRNRNIVFDAIEDFLVNEEGNAEHIDFKTIFPYLEEYSIPIGFIAIDDDKGILFTYDISGTECIGILSKGGSKFSPKLITHGALGFTLENRVYGTFRYNTKREIVVTFWDGNVETKIINLDNPAFVSGINPVTKHMKDATEISSSFLYQSASRPKCSLVSVNDSGGILRTGSYYVFVTFKDSDLTRTNYMVVSDVIQITDQDRNGSSDLLTYDGSLPDSNTTKSATITLTELDDRYTYISIGIISRINGIVTASIITEDLHISNSLSYTITGFETATVVSLEEVLTPRISYKKNKTGLQFNKALYLANLEGLRDVGYQKYANNINVDLALHKKKAEDFTDSFKNEVTIYFDKGLMPSEVYALFIQFELNDGSLSFNYPIPGRSVQHISGMGLDAFYENDLVSIMIGTEAYLRYDAFIDPKVRYFQTRDTAYNSYAMIDPDVDSNMGYWENQDEVYPASGDDWEIWEQDPANLSQGRKKLSDGNIFGQKVRHHKIPSWDTIDINNGGNNSSFLDYNTKQYGLIGLRIKNIFIPADIQSQVRRFRITYAKRQYTNSMVMDQSIAFFNISSRGAGYPANRPYETTETLDMVSVAFYPFSLLMDKPQLMTTFMVNQLMYVNGVMDQYSSAMYERFRFGQLGSLPTYNSYKSYAGGPERREEFKIRGIKNVSYIAYNVNTSSINNTQGQELVFADMSNGGLQKLLTQPSYLYSPVSNYYGSLMSLCIWRENCYQGFDSQEIVATPIWFNVTSGVYFYDTSTHADRRYDVLLGFDTYTNKYAHRVTRTGFSYVHDYYVNSRYNIERRNEGEDDNQHYYPKTQPMDVINTKTWIDRGSSETNYFAFNGDYNALNDIETSIVVPKNNVNITDFSSRVIRSAGEDEESLYENWKIILANDYYDIPRDKGPITGISVLADTILINTTRSLFRTTGKKQLSMSEITMYIAAGDVFSQMPTDFSVGDEATLGTKSQGSMCPCPAGLFYVNDMQGRAFIVGEKPIEVSSFGMRNEWKDTMKLNLREEFKAVQSDIEDYFNFDNSVKGIGYTSAYDQRYERIIVTKRDVAVADGYTFHGVQDYASVPYQDNYLFIAQGLIFLSHLSGLKTVVDIWNSLAFVDKSVTLSFNIRHNIWVAYHDYHPSLIFNTDVSLYSAWHDYKVWIHNVRDSYGWYYGVKHDSVFEVVGVDGKENMFLSMVWSSYVKERITGVEKFNETITDLMLYNSKQCSGEIGLTNLTNVRKIKGLWRCNEFRDMVLDYAQPFMTSNNVVDTGNIDVNKIWYKRNKFKDKYVVAQMIHDNASQNKIMISGYDFYVQPSIR